MTRCARSSSARGGVSASRESPPGNRNQAHHANDYPEDDESSDDDNEPRRMEAPRGSGDELLAYAWDSELDAEDDDEN